MSTKSFNLKDLSLIKEYLTNEVDQHKKLLTKTLDKIQNNITCIKHSHNMVPDTRTLISIDTLLTESKDLIKSIAQYHSKINEINNNIEYAKNVNNDNYMKNMIAKEIADFKAEQIVSIDQTKINDDNYMKNMISKEIADFKAEQITTIDQTSAVKA